MKCENCGAEYGARELKCPYCGTKNLTGAQWQQEEEHAQQRMRQEKSWAIRKASIYVVNRVANVILLVSLALFVLSIVVVAILCKVEEIRDDHKRAQAVYEDAEKLYLEEDFVALDHYLDDHDLYYSHDEKYDVLCEAALFYDNKLDFQEEWMRYDRWKDEKDYMEDYSEYGAAAYMLKRCSDILGEDGYGYQIDHQENQKYLDELREHATVFLVSEFQYTEEDIERLKQTRSYEDEFENIVREAYRRKGWIYRETSES